MSTEDRQGRLVSPHHVYGCHSAGWGALAGGDSRGQRGQGRQACLRRGSGVGQAVSQTAVLVFHWGGGLGHPGLGLLQQRPGLWPGLLPLQPCVLTILPLFRWGVSPVLLKGHADVGSVFTVTQRKSGARVGKLTIRILMISLGGLLMPVSPKDKGHWNRGVENSLKVVQVRDNSQEISHGSWLNHHAAASPISTRTTRTTTTETMGTGDSQRKKPSVHWKVPRARRVTL